MITTADDGLPAEVVGDWAKDKHRYLCHYVDASRGARARYLGPGKAGATFVDLFCAFGRAQVRGTPEFIEGSPVAAWRVSAKGGAPFSQVYIADINDERRSTCRRRLEAIGAPVRELTGGAVEAAAAFVREVNPNGLHFAFLDPHNLRTLDFRIIQQLSRLKRIDMLIHVSAMDLQRSLPGQLSDEDEVAFDRFAPGWRTSIDTSGPQVEVRRRLLEYWGSQVEALKIPRPFTNSRMIKGPRGQRLYWLMLASRSRLAQELWDSITRSDTQRPLL